MGVQKGQPLFRKAEKKHRAKSSCLYYVSSAYIENGTRCSLTTYPECHPETCPWYRSQDMAYESYERARAIWKKNHGKDNYYELGYGPKRRLLPKNEEDEA